MQLVLDTRNLHLQKKGDSFYIKSEKGSRTISPVKLTSIAITAHVQIDSDAVVLAIKHQVPILFFDRIGKMKARMWSPYFESIATLRRQQLRFTESVEATAWMVDLFQLKTEEQVINLQLLQRHKFGLSFSLPQAIHSLKKQSRSFEQYREQLPEECRNSMMGTEGTAARSYWQAVGNSLPKEYAFQGRSRRPAEDHFNAALNYLYGMLYSIVEGGIFAAGLDPQLGILHTDAHTKPTLAFDLIEPFRPMTDRLLITLCLEHKLLKSHFTANQHGLFLNKEGKAFLIPLFNDYLRTKQLWLKREASFKNHIYFLAGQLAQRIRAMGN